MHPSTVTDISRVSYPIAGGLSLYVVLLKKQVGVLSPLLFNIYLAKLNILVVLKLEAQGLGCHRNGMFVGAFIYADDITILAPTSTSLNKILTTCTY